MGRPRRDTLPARAQRLPALRPRQVDLPELRPGRVLRRRLPSALRRHQPREGRAGICRRHPGGVQWLGFEWGEHLYASDYFDKMYACAIQPDQGRQGLCRFAVGRGDARQPRHPDRGGQEQPVPRAQRRREPRPLRAHARRRIRRGRTSCAPRSTWRAPTSTCATRRSTASATPPTIAPATPGAPTRCTFLRPSDRGRDRGHHHSVCTLEFEDQRPFYDWLLDALATEGHFPARCPGRSSSPAST